jgi:VWFA-related protein
MASGLFLKRAAPLALVLVAAALTAPFDSLALAHDKQELPQQELPRFRSGANLVRLDAYVTADGKPVTGLTVNDFEVLEDGRPQRVESFEMITPRPAAPEAVRVEPSSVEEARQMATAAEARLFVLFLDIWHVHLEGSYRAQNPITNFLNRAIGQDDMVGVMTPEMTARNLTLARRTTTIEGLLRDNWTWGQRQRLTTPDPREHDIEQCYPALPGTPQEDLVREMIERRRTRKTLDSIEDLIVHLEGLRDERKFVVLLSEGWLLPGRNTGLARPFDPKFPTLPKVDPIGIDPQGKLTAGERTGDAKIESCDRERMFLAETDFHQDFQNLLHRANRSNISFYTLDPRGLVAFDEDLSAKRALKISEDQARLASRQESLREMATATDGIALLNTNNLDAALNRMLADVGSYYLLGYYSTNTKLDGRFRRLTVRVKRPAVDVRARPGYLAPTEAEAAAARVDRLMNGAKPGFSDTPPDMRRALDRITPSRTGVSPLRVSAAGAPGRITLTTEIDASILKNAEWRQGGTARVTIEHSRGQTAPIQRDLTLEPGQRSFNLDEAGDGELQAGRYIVRLSVTPKGGTLPLQTSLDVTVPDAGALLGANGIASRRGPTTGLQYVATADARYQRTERIRFEVPRLSADGTVSARLLSRNGQPLPLSVTLTERVDDPTKIRYAVADVTLAPLAQGEYVLEIAVLKDGKTERAVYGFRIVP